MKKILAMVLSLCLCFGLLAGCGSNGSTASSGAQSAAPTAAADEGSASRPVALEYWAWVAFLGMLWTAAFRPLR